MNNLYYFPNLATLQSMSTTTGLVGNKTYCNQRNHELNKKVKIYRETVPIFTFAFSILCTTILFSIGYHLMNTNRFERKIVIRSTDLLLFTSST